MTATHQNTTAGTPSGEFPFFRTLETTCNRISNPVLEVAKEAARTSCLHQVSLIEKKPIWNVSDAVRWAYYKLEGNARANDVPFQTELVEQTAAVLNACLAKMRKVKPEELYLLYGIKPGSEAEQVVQARQCAESALARYAELEEKYTNDYNDLKSQVTELSVRLQQANNEKTAAEALLAESDRVNAELRASLQKAQESATQVNETEGVQTLKAQLEEAINTIRAQSERIKQLETAAKTKVDEEILQVIEFLHRHLPDTQQTLEVRLAVFFLMNNLEARK